MGRLSERVRKGINFLTHSEQNKKSSQNRLQALFMSETQSQIPKMREKVAVRKGIRFLTGSDKKKKSPQIRLQALFPSMTNSQIPKNRKKAAVCKGILFLTTQTSGR